MMRFIRKNDYSVRTAISEFKMNDMPIIGRGSFALVFDAGDSVMKLTLDSMSHEFASIYGDGSPFFPKCIEFFGYLDREIVFRGREFGLHLYRYEKLSKMTDSEDKSIVTLARRLVRACNRPSCGSREGENENFFKKLIPTLSGDLAQFQEPFSTLEVFCRDYGRSAHPDFQLSNLMLRGDQIVLNDPFFNLKIWRQVHGG